MAEVSISNMLHHLSTHMQKVFNNYDWDVNITASQMKILMFVARMYEEGKPVFQKDIEKEFNIKGSSVTSMLNTLEKNKWISRERVEYDARLRLIVLAEMSYKMMDQLKKYWENVDYSIKNILSEAEFIVFSQCIEKIMNELSDK